MQSTWHFKNKMYTSETRLLTEDELDYFNRNKGELL